MDASTVQQILDSAARAASSDDYASAESLLREAAHLQESSLGSEHPDLASTFNNLAIICEKEHKLTDAGEFYRRAFAIASASLDSDHPLVLTSRENLDEFRRVHGTLDEVTGRLKPAPTSPSDDTTAEPFPSESTLAAAATPGRRLPLVIVVVAAIVLLGAFAMLRGTRSAPRVAEGPKAVRETSSAPAAPPAQPAEKNVRVAPRPPSGTPARTVVPATSKDERPRIVEASLCQSLSTSGGQWECAAASDPAAAGSLYFYTRIAAATSTRVHHRWYRNGTLRQDVDLAIQANPAAGYRTYSRQRLDSGDWRVEAVTAEGVVLHEARVAIR
ncbi:MAG TPA: DUF2914 domain-containing protein [Vicinamibacterales bacterium]|nr:DUF2914 domain-containing protein [Vicinamibacterales bacterium]